MHTYTRTHASTEPHAQGIVLYSRLIADKISPLRPPRRLPIGRRQNPSSSPGLPVISRRDFFLLHPIRA